MIQTTPSPHTKKITRPCILNGITKIHDKFRKWGLKSKLHIMDNEVSEYLKWYFGGTFMQFQLVTPPMNHRNTSEQVTRAFKNHVIVALCTLYL